MNWFLVCAVTNMPVSFFWQNAQRLAAGAQVAQTLTTPVVSVATPSLLAQGLPFSAMPTAYNTGEINTQALGVKKTFWLREKAILIFFLIDKLDW